VARDRWRSDQTRCGSAYPLLKVREIVPVIIDSGVFRPDDHAHLYVWATNTHLGDGLEVIRELGFRYITGLTWAKPGFGIGQYFRGQTEHLLFAVRGKGLDLRRAWTDQHNLSTLITADWVRNDQNKRIHSAKPREAFALIEAASPPPRLEMFARQPRQGWTTWGNELPQAATKKSQADRSV